MKKAGQSIAGRGLTKVFPIGCSIPRATLVHGEGILELHSFGLYISMKDCSVVENR